MACPLLLITAGVVAAYVWCLCFCQVEKVALVTHGCPKLGKLNNLHYPGSTVGDTLYGVPLPDYTFSWVLQWKDKKEMLGEA